MQVYALAGGLRGADGKCFRLGISRTFRHQGYLTTKAPFAALSNSPRLGFSHWAFDQACWPFTGPEHCEPIVPWAPPSSRLSQPAMRSFDCVSVGQARSMMISRSGLAVKP
jgi:hypothetical protein